MTDEQIEQELCKIYEMFSRINYAFELEDYLRWKIGTIPFDEALEEKAKAATEKNTEVLINILAVIASEAGIPLPKMRDDPEWREAVEKDRRERELRNKENT